MQLLTASFPSPLQRICQVICEKIGKPAVRTLASWECHQSKLKSAKAVNQCVFTVSLLCPRLMLLEATKDFVMRQKNSMPNARFIQEMSFSPNVMATCAVCLKVATIPDTQYKINLCITHNIKGTYDPLSLYFCKNSSPTISPLYSNFPRYI